MSKHVKKCWPESFQAIREGRKAFEWRAEDDCHYEAGDTLCLREFVAVANAQDGIEHYTGREETMRVTYVLRDAFGVPPGFAVLSISRAVVDSTGSLKEAMTCLRWAAGQLSHVDYHARPEDAAMHDRTMDCLDGTRTP